MAAQTKSQSQPSFSVKFAVRNLKEEEEKERQRKEREEQDEAVEQAALQKRRLEEYSKRAWDGKKKINGIKNYIDIQNNNITKALETGLRLIE